MTTTIPEFKPCVSKPCPDCAFRRSSKPGNLGGSSPGTYIGQALGPFYVPCHMQYGDRTMKEVKTDFSDIHQCAGLSIFRTHIGVASLMPPELPCLPPDPEVFESFSQFLAHHKGISQLQALVELSYTPPIEHLRRELSKREVKIMPLPSKLEG